MVAGLGLILANPVCICRAESMPSAEAVEATETQSSCCSKRAEPSGDAPAPFVPAPCDCEISVNEGLAQAQDKFAIPTVDAQAFQANKSVLTIQPALTFALSIAAPPAAEFRGPPLRHLHSVYRL